MQATQLEGRGNLNAAQRRGVLEEWIDFLANGETNIVDLDLVSRVPQRLLDAATSQRRLRRLVVKWGPYRDLSALSGMSVLEDLALGGATSVESLDPLRSLSNLTRLHVSQAQCTSTVHAIGALTGLRELSFGNAYPGSDRTVSVNDVGWTRSLRELRRLELPGTRILDSDLTPLVSLPRLEVLRLPLRRSYRKQVFEFARSSRAFAQLASEYEAHDTYRASRRG